MLVLDTSYSMSGAPIAQLNAGFQHFVAALQEDEVAACSVELGVITAGGVATEALSFTTAMHIDSVAQFNANGGTPLGRATELALQRLDDRKKISACWCCLLPTVAGNYQRWNANRQLPPNHAES
jgi:uncharacterized protein YegL